jgi:hypothetical protein
MHDLALSVVRSKGKRAPGDPGAIQCKYGNLTIRYWTKQHWLDVVCILTVEHFAGRPHVTLYMPGQWERRLIEAAKVGA